MLEIEVVSLKGFEDEFAKAPKAATQAARFAINAGARKLASASSKQIRGSITFGARELYSPANPKAGKISVLLASDSSLEARVRGADRPTLLSRFAVNRPTGKRKIVPRVRVSPRKTAELARSWFMRFPNGQVGIAVRLKPGETMRNRKLGNAYPLKGSPNAFVLFGPSVEQALGQAAPDNLRAVEKLVNDEFLRQFTRLSK